MSHEKPCGDEIIVQAEGVDLEGQPQKMSVFCRKSHGHPFVGFDDPRSRKYAFHEGDGWVWDNRCAWKKGTEPTA